MIDREALEALGLPTIKDNTDHVLNLIRGRQIDDPKLYEAISILCDQIGEVTRSISPIATILTARTVAGVLLLPPIDFNYSFTNTTIRLTWTRPSLSGLLTYELRFGGTDWDDASFVLRTQSTSVDVPPFVGLNGTFRLKTLNDAGEYSLDEITVDVVVVAPGVVNVTGQVIDNNILLSWSTPLVGSFGIDYYDIKRDGVSQGVVRGTFTSFFEVVSGVYVYTVTPVDIAGNIGTSADIELIVSQPPDYVLQDERTSTFSGTRVNALLLDDPGLLVNVAEESWEDHFTTRFWDHPQDQVDAGFPIYIQPGQLTGSYEEVVDFGVILQNVIATVRFNTEMLTGGTMTTLVKLAASDDNVSYTPFASGSSQFLPSLRYLKLRLEFTASATSVLMQVFNLITTLAVKRENDGGEEFADLTDVLGTEVFFNKDFKDVESITATVLSPTEPFVVIVDFADIPDPVSFRVFVFDTTGNRVSKTIEWKARGVV